MNSTYNTPTRPEIRSPMCGNTTTHLQEQVAGVWKHEQYIQHTYKTREQVAGVWKYEQYIRHTYKAREQVADVWKHDDTPTRAGRWCMET